jgi:hypothetical protein
MADSEGNGQGFERRVFGKRLFPPPDTVMLKNLPHFTISHANTKGDTSVSKPNEASVPLFPPPLATEQEAAQPQCVDGVLKYHFTEQDKHC